MPNSLSEVAKIVVCRHDAAHALPSTLVDEGTASNKAVRVVQIDRVPMDVRVHVPGARIGERGSTCSRRIGRGKPASEGVIVAVTGEVVTMLIPFPILPSQEMLDDREHEGKDRDFRQCSDEAAYDSAPAIKNKEINNYRQGKDE